VVKLDDDFLTHCPYASRFPFEMHIHPRRHLHDYSAMDDGMLMRLAYHLKEVLRRMQAALDNPSYNFIIHTSPAVEGRDQRANYWSTLEFDWHWHIEILPRITNVAGFEWGTGFYINPTAPEDAARFLREVDIKKD
jgi:UDPglucose--hexose-1-phosphate uridylyltransferase